LEWRVLVKEWVLKGAVGFEDPAILPMVKSGR
jgi:hypothetical protein